MALDRICAGLAACCATDGDAARHAARELVRSGGDPGPGEVTGLSAALAVGFATAPGDVVRRRHIARLACDGGEDPRRLAATCAIAAMASYAAAGAPVFSVFAAAVEEAGAVTAAAREPLTRAAVRGRDRGDLAPGDPLASVAAVVAALSQGEDGDDTTVAALAAGIAAARAGGAGPDADAELETLAEGLCALRT